jgi:hypothetical protein
MSSPSVEVESVDWVEGADKSRARRLSLLLFGVQSERGPGDDGAHDDTEDDE